MSNKMSFCLAITTLFFTACGGEKEKDPEIADTNVAKETTIHCFQKISGQDTIWLTLNKTGVKVTGNLIYDFFEKDRNEGMLKGEMSGDTVFADYTFKSEGKESVREVAFLLKEVDLAEGHGEMVERSGTQKFTDKKAVHFQDTVLFRNIPCPEQQ